jgi:hypothetical protein
MNDLSDDDLLQNLAVAMQRYAARFGEDELLKMLEDMTETLLEKREHGVSDK